MDPTDVAQLNKFLVLDAIRSNELLTRRQLGKDLQLSGASVSRIVRTLLAEGSIEELAGEQGDAGRRPKFLRFVSRVGSVIAIDLGGTKCHGALADLAGEVIEEDVRPSRGHGNATAAVLACLDVLRSSAQALGMPVLAVVIGIPALIDPETGLAAAGPNVGWNGFDLRGALAASLPEPLEIDNDANLAALGQAWRGQAAGVRSFVTLALGTGIGGGIVIDGKLVRGRHNAAGEVGQLLTGPGGLRDGARADLEYVASGPGIRARAAELIRENPETVLAGTAFDTRDVFSAAAQRDQVAAQVIEEVLDHLAMAIVDITAILDPDLVILDGSVGQALEPWLSGLQERVQAHVFRAPTVAVSKLGANATIVGAIGRGLTMVSESAAPAVLNLAGGRFRLPNAPTVVDGAGAADGR